MSTSLLMYALPLLDKDGICNDLRMPIQAIIGRAFLCLKVGRSNVLRSGGLMS